MKKIKCSYCGVFNFQGVSACFNCKKSTLPINKRSGQNPIKFHSSNWKKICRTIFILLILGGISIFGYKKYNVWMEAQTKIETAEKEQKEVENFKELFFNPNTESAASAIFKLPTRFRVAPPDLDIINKFPFRENMVSKMKPQIIERGYTPLPYTTGGRMSGDGNWVKFSNAEELRMLKVKKITGYKYSKDSVNRLMITVGFIAEFQHLIQTETSGNCPNKIKYCVESYIREGRGYLEAVRVNDAWDIYFIKGGSPYTIEWKKETAHLVNKNQQPDLIPNFQHPKVVTVEDAEARRRIR